MKLYVVFRWINYGKLSERTEVMGIYLDHAEAHRVATRFKWTIEIIPANRVRVDGGALRQDSWVEAKKLVTPEQEQVLRELNLWRHK